MSDTENVACSHVGLVQLTVCCCIDWCCCRHSARRRPRSASSGWPRGWKSAKDGLSWTCPRWNWAVAFIYLC